MPTPIRLAAAFLTATLFASPLLAQNEAAKGKIKLVAAVKAGASYQIERLTKTTMSGRTHTGIEDTTLTAAAHGKDGKEKLVRSKVDRVRIETNATGDGEAITYDSSDPAKQHPTLADQAKGMLAITSAAIYGEDEVFKSFQGEAANAASQEMMQKLTDLGFPKTPVGPGDRWKHKVETNMGQMGKVSYDLDYKFVKMVRHDGVNCALLTITGKISTVPGSKANEGFDLQSRSLRGVMYFDPKLGAVRKNEINANLDLTAYGKKMPGSMTMRTVLKKYTKG